MGKEKEKTEGMKNVSQLIAEEDGVAVIEVILVLVVLIGLVLIFKSQLTVLVNNIFDTITQKSGTV